jgi:NTP pyrophosphatase (non-canonical NTP hydrolase)
MHNAGRVPSRNFLYDTGIARPAPPAKALAMPALTDAATSVADLKTRILAFVREREWEQFHAPKNLSMALAAEAAELMEHFLWSTPEQSRAIAQDPAKRAKIAEELADVVIYALEFANATGLDVAAAIEAKMAANAAKYPVEKARGRADKYTEL